MTARTWTIRLPYARPPLSLNDRMHWAAKSRLTREVRALTALRARQAGIPALEAVRIVLHWVPRDGRRRDTDNPFPTLKAAIDGVRDAGVVPDDSSEFVTSRVVIDPPDPKDPHLFIDITEVETPA